MKEIPLTKGYVALVDDEDYDRIGAYSWCASVEVQSDGHRQVYAVGAKYRENGIQKLHRMHRMVVHCPDGFDVDHIDGNGLNNARSNLRICSRSENMQNQRIRTGSSVFKGVNWQRRDRR